MSFIWETVIVYVPVIIGARNDMYHHYEAQKLTLLGRYSIKLNETSSLGFLHSVNRGLCCETFTWLGFMRYGFLKNALSNLDCTHAYDSGGLEYIEVQNSSGAREMSDDSLLALQGRGPEFDLHYTGKGPA